MNRLPVPTMFGRDKFPEIEIKEADFYISTNGCDANDGSIDAPFATFERAREAARSSGKASVIAVKSGDYNLCGFVLDERDSGCTYRAYGDGEVRICGGVKINNKDLERPSPEIIARLTPDAAEHIVCCDLKKYGLTVENWGNVNPRGNSTVYMYDNFPNIKSCEIFWNDIRLTYARYPNEGYLSLADVADVGDPADFPFNEPMPSCKTWGSRRNHDGGTYVIDEKTNERAKNWKEPEKGWIFGYFCHDWSDSSTPIKSLDTNTGYLKPAHVSKYGSVPGAKYYFYNIIEEIDAPGEFYLDRESGILYMYPLSDPQNADIELSVNPGTIITIEGANNVTIEGMNITCSKGGGIVIKGNENSIIGCTVKNTYEYAIEARGSNNTISCCEISHIGRGGIILSGGDGTDLTPGENIASYNLIHDFGEIFQTNQAAIRLDGVGNIAAHNEIYNTPHLAIYYGGNDHIIEYNLIHDVVLYSGDAGAIYGGRSWTSQGTVIRYNAIWNVGFGDMTPNGIYWDDAFSGQTAYGNFMININYYSFLIGGGRDHNVSDNILINTGNKGSNNICYDSRMRDAVTKDGWAKRMVYDKNCSLWIHLVNTPYQEEIWSKKYPTLAKIKTDLNTDTEDIDFVVNPSYSNVCNNLLVDERESDEEVMSLISDGAKKFSKIENNRIYRMNQLDELFVDYANGNYHLKDNTDFPEPPYDMMGIRF